MRYIIKNGKIFGIYSNNYENLTGKPLINNVELAEGKSYSSSDLNIIKHMAKAEYDALTTKDPNCYYVVSTETVADISNFDYLNIDNKPSINNVTLTGNKSLLDLNLYSIDEIDNKIASSRSVKVQATKPTTSDVLANTLYYIGPDSNSKYHVYLYDSNKVEADLGSSDVDLSGYQPTTDRVSTLNYTADDTTYPTTTAVFTETPQVRAGHLTLNSVTTMDELLEGLFKDGTVKHGNATKKAFAYVNFGSTIGAMLPAIAGASTSFNNGFVEAEIFSTTKDSNPIVFATIKLRCVYSNVTVQNIKGNNGAWSGWQVVNGDVFAPISTSKYVGVFKQPDDCIVPFGFNRILNMANERATIEGLFVSRMTDPVDGTSGLFGDLKVRQQCFGGSVAGSATNICIEQTFETYLRGSPTQRKVFFRRGYLADSGTDIDINDVSAIKNSLTWLPWYPIDYPQVTIPTTSLNTSVVTYGNIQYKITGGILIIDFNFLKFATASQNGQIITTNNNFSWISSAIAKINCHCVIHGWKTTVAPTSGFASLAIADKKITVYDVQADNKEYYGQMIVPLGY